MERGQCGAALAATTAVMDHTSLWAARRAEVGRREISLKEFLVMDHRKDVPCPMNCRQNC